MNIVYKVILVFFVLLFNSSVKSAIIHWKFVVDPPVVVDGAPTDRPQFVSFSTMDNQVNGGIDNFSFGNFSLDDSQFTNGPWAFADFTVQDGVILFGSFSAIEGIIPGSLGGSNPVPQDQWLVSIFNIPHPSVDSSENQDESKGNWDLILINQEFTSDQQINIVDTGGLTVVPVPGAFLLFGTSLIGLVVRSKIRKNI